MAKGMSEKFTKFRETREVTACCSGGHSNSPGIRAQEMTSPAFIRISVDVKGFAYEVSASAKINDSFFRGIDDVVPDLVLDVFRKLQECQGTFCLEYQKLMIITPSSIRLVYTGSRYTQACVAVVYQRIIPPDPSRSSSIRSSKVPYLRRFNSSFCRD